MYFYRKIRLIVLVLGAIAFILFFRNHKQAALFEIFLCVWFLICATYYKIENGSLSKYILGIPIRALAISDIKLIEIVKVNQMGWLTIRIGKGGQYDGFYLNMKDGNRYKLYQDFTNHENVELGMYLIESKHIASRKTERIRFFTDRL